MRNYIILFLLWGVFGNAQYNLFARQNFAKSVSAPTYNTYIGGVSGTIATASALATKLGISVGAISNFTVVGSDIKCKITGSYAIPALCFDYESITYYRDTDSLVSDIGSSAFSGCSLLREFESEGITSITGTYVFNVTPSLLVIKFPNLAYCGTMVFRQSDSSIPPKHIYIPICSNLGGTVGNDFVFENMPAASILYLNPSLATNNSGSPDGDISALSGVVIRYVNNFTPPNPVTTLTAGTVYKTAIQLNFTPPSSTNAIDYYEVYVDGIFNRNIKSSGQFIDGLIANTNYDITIVLVDVFFNKSTESNSINVTTTNSLSIPATGLISYYALSNNSKDGVGINDGVDTNVLYLESKIGNGAVYNGATSKTVIGNPTNLQLSSGTIACWIKTTSPGASYRSIFGKTNAYNMFLVDGVFGIYSWAGTTGFKSTTMDLRDGNWHHVAFVFESGTSLNYLYVDGVLKLTTSMTISNQSFNAEIGASTGTSQNINALIDEAVIYNVKLTQDKIDVLYNSGAGTTL